MKPASLPSIKLRPDLLPKVLQIISKNEANRKAMDEEVHQLFREASGRLRPPSLRNASRAVTYPSLRRLGLLFGEGTNIHLTATGLRLLRASEEGKVSYERELARHLVRWDLDGPSLLGERGLVVSQTLLSDLARAFSDSMPYGVAEDRLSRLLPFYETAGLINRIGPAFVRNAGQVQAAKAPNLLPPPAAAEFVKALLNEYDSLIRSRSSPIVPIPLIERAMTERFGGRLWADEFRTLLSKLPQETEEYVLHFSQPMSREPLGIRIRGKYFYYVQIHRRR